MPSLIVRDRAERTAEGIGCLLLGEVEALAPCDESGGGHLATTNPWALA